MCTVVHTVSVFRQSTQNCLIVICGNIFLRKNFSFSLLTTEHNLTNISVCFLFPDDRDSKLTMLLRESLGNMNCRTTMIAHISASPSNFSETLSTLQIASRVLRMKKKKAKVSVV